MKLGNSTRERSAASQAWLACRGFRGGERKSIVVEEKCRQSALSGERKSFKHRSSSFRDKLFGGYCEHVEEIYRASSWSESGAIWLWLGRLRSLWQRCWRQVLRVAAIGANWIAAPNQLDMWERPCGTNWSAGAATFPGTTPPASPAVSGDVATFNAISSITTIAINSTSSPNSKSVEPRRHDIHRHQPQ